MRWMILSTALSMAIGTAAQAAPIYKWVDAQGVTHFDAQPPVGQQTQEVDIQKPPTPSSNPASPVPNTLESDARQRAIDEKVRRQVKAQEAQRAEACEIVRTNLAQLKNNPRVREQVEGGEYKRLTQEERQARIDETQKAIDDHCK